MTKTVTLDLDDIEALSAGYVPNWLREECDVALDEPQNVANNACCLCGNVGTDSLCPTHRSALIQAPA